MRWIVFLAALLFSVSNPAQALEPEPDPMARNLIFVDGKAEVTVPVNGFDLIFGFDIEKGSFAGSERSSRDVIEKIKKDVQTLKLTNVQFLQSWDLVKQAKISFSTKGRKISNQLTVRVTDFPAGKMHELIAKIIDLSLEADSNLALEDVKVFLTNESEVAAKKAATEQALANLQANAAKTAEKIGRQLTDPKRIFVTSDYQVIQADGGPHQAEMMRMANFVSVQKSFRIEAQIIDTMTVSSQVSGIYELGS